MQRYGDKTLYSASDLVGFLECEHATTLDTAHLVTPMTRAIDDESTALIQAKGVDHERSFLESLRAQGLRIAEIEELGDPEDRMRETQAAMQAGYEVIYQATLLS